VAIPQTVIDERVRHKLEDVEGLKQIYTSLKKINNSLDISKLINFDYKKEFEKLTSDFISSKKIKLIPIPPDIDFEQIYIRSIEKTAPFSSGGKEFKDTVIWLSIKNFAKDYKNSNFIIVTANVRDFPKEVLDKELDNGNKLIILDKLFNVPPYLEKEFERDEEMFNKQRKIETEVKEHIGELLLELNKKRFFYGYGERTGITCLKLKGFDFQGILVGEPAYVSIKLQLEPIFENKANSNSGLASLNTGSSYLTGSNLSIGSPYITNSYSIGSISPSYGIYTKETVEVNIDLEYFSSTGDIKLNNITPNYPLEMDIFNY
jgi:hypothetical protein